MTNLIKSFYISLYVTLLSVASLHALIELSQNGFDSAWLGISLAVLPSLLFFIRLFVSPIARTSANLNALPVFAALGSVLALVLSHGPEQDFYSYLYACALGVGGALLYIYWYSRFGREQSAVLQTGKPLPAFTLISSEGQAWSSNELRNHPALILFYRGNWCPLCMAQIKEIAAQYQTLEKMGVRVYLVSPQPETHTRSLAKKFDVNYQFMTDRDNQAAKVLDIEAEQGTPKGMEVLGYDSDTVLPTAIMTDAKGHIIFTDQTDNYRVRPEPETFIRVFEEHGFSPS